MNINNLEKEINFILSKYYCIEPYIHYPIQVYSENYNDIYAFWENNKKTTNIKEETLNQKILTLQLIKAEENKFITLTSQLTTKFNEKKINTKLNKILKIITFGYFDVNKKIEKKIIILEKIKEIKQQNLVKIYELEWRIKKKDINKNDNSKNSTVVNSLKLTFS